MTLYVDPLVPLNTRVVKLDKIGNPLLNLIVVYMPVIWLPAKSADLTVRTFCPAEVVVVVVVEVVLVVEVLLLVEVSKVATSVGK